VLMLPFFLVAAHMYVSVVCPPIRKVMDKARITMGVEYDRLVFGKEGFED